MQYRLIKSRSRELRLDGQEGVKFAELSGNVLYCRTMSSEMLRMRMQIAALEESLASCDDQRISLKYQVNGLEAEVESLKEALQRRRKSDSGTTELQTLKVHVLLLQFFES